MRHAYMFHSIMRHKKSILKDRPYHIKIILRFFNDSLEICVGCRQVILKVFYLFIFIWSESGKL